MSPKDMVLKILNGPDVAGKAALLKPANLVNIILRINKRKGITCQIWIRMMNS